MHIKNPKSKIFSYLCPLENSARTWYQTWCRKIRFVSETDISLQYHPLWYHVASV